MHVYMCACVFESAGTCVHMFCVHVCVHVSSSLPVHTCIRACARVCTWMCACVHRRCCCAHIIEHARARTYLCVCMCVYTSLCIHMCMSLSLCICVFVCACVTVCTQAWAACVHMLQTQMRPLGDPWENKCGVRLAWASVSPLGNGLLDSRINGQRGHYQMSVYSLCYGFWSWHLSSPLILKANPRLSLLSTIFCHSKIIEAKMSNHTETWGKQWKPHHGRGSW